MITSAQITSYIGTYMWAFIRVGAMVASAPVISSNSIPVRVKLGISLVLTLAILPILPAAPAVEPISADALLIALHQVLIGVAMGLAMQMVFTMFVIGGQVIAYQMGLGFSQMVDPNSGLTEPVISQFYIILITLMFFTLNGHLAMVHVLANSFQTLPIAPDGISVNGFWSLVSWGSQMYAGGVQIALPAIASILLINLTFAVITRSAPQFNIFAIGFPITIIVGFFIIMLTLGTVIPHFQRELVGAYNLFRSITGGP